MIHRDSHRSIYLFYRLNALYEMLSDYQWLNAYIQMGMVDEIINCLSYVVCPVPIGRFVRT